MILDLVVAHGTSTTSTRRPLCGPLSLSVALHGLFLLIAAVVLSHQGQPSQSVARLLTAGRLTWAGPEGSGSADAQSAESSPARRVNASRADGPQRADRVAPPEFDRPPILSFAVPPMPEAAGLRNLPGVMTALPPAGLEITAAGSGSNGTGDGQAGRGTSGPGGEGGVGDGDAGPGSGGGVTMPTLLRQVAPAYTAEALGARVQGIVTVEAVVRADGSVGDVRVLKSFESSFGLDAEAIRAVKQWRFRPGTRRGVAVPMFVTVELTFTLH
jgi:periplasmic protein TonB